MPTAAEAESGQSWASGTPGPEPSPVDSLYMSDQEAGRKAEAGLSRRHPKQQPSLLCPSMLPQEVERFKQIVRGFMNRGVLKSSAYKKQKELFKSVCKES